MQKSDVCASLKISSFSYETERLGARPIHAVFMLLHVFMCFGFVMVVCGDAEPRLLRLKLLVLLPESSWIKDEPLHADCRCDLACQAKPTRLSPVPPPGPIQDIGAHGCAKLSPQPLYRRKRWHQQLRNVFIPKKEKDVSNPKKELRSRVCCLSPFSSSACQTRFLWGIYIRIESIKWRAAAAAPTSARSGRLFSMWQKRHPPHWHQHRHPQLHRCQRNYRIRIQQSH